MLEVLKQIAQKACSLHTAFNLVMVEKWYNVQANEVVYNPQTPTLGGSPGTSKGAAGVAAGAAGATALRAHAGSPTGHSPTVGYGGGLAPAGQKIRRKSGAFTSGAVTHPASLAAAGKPTGLEDIVNSPSFSRGNTPNQSPTVASQSHFRT